METAPTMPFFTDPDDAAAYWSRRGGRGFRADSPETAVRVWFTIPGNPSLFDLSDAELEPIDVDTVHYRVRADNDDGSYGPWWTFRCTVHDGGWIVEAYDFPPGANLGYAYWIVDSDSPTDTVMEWHPVTHDTEPY